jgi:hypothetical protein
MSTIVIVTLIYVRQTPAKTIHVRQSLWSSVRLSDVGFTENMADVIRRVAVISMRFPHSGICGSELGTDVAITAATIYRRRLIFQGRKLREHTAHGAAIVLYRQSVKQGRVAGCSSCVFIT